jgi:hypothetical protein
VRRTGSGLHRLARLHASSLRQPTSGLRSLAGTQPESLATRARLLRPDPLRLPSGTLCAGESGLAARERAGPICSPHLAARLRVASRAKLGVAATRGEAASATQAGPLSPDRAALPRRVCIYDTLCGGGGCPRRQRARVARDRLGARSRAQAASGLTGSMRVSELVAEEDTPRRPKQRSIRSEKRAQPGGQVKARPPRRCKCR